MSGPQPVDLAAFLAGAEYATLQAPHGSGGEAPEALLSAGTYYAPRLLAAVKKVLELHKPEGRQRTLERCERHRDPWAKTFVQVGDCPDCRHTERVICWQAKCREEEWPCTEYRAISRALLGEGDAPA